MRDRSLFPDKQGRTARVQTFSIEQGLRALQRFLVAEWRLALPVALAFLAFPPLILTLVARPFFVTAPATFDGMRTLGAALPGWFVPLLALLALVTAAGALALTALAVLPRISVGEAIVTALRRLPIWIAACMIVAAGTFVLLALIATIAAVIGGGQVAIFTATFVTLIAASLYLVLVMPVLVETPLGPIAVLRRAWTIYHGFLPRLAAGLILFVGVAWVASMAVQVALGSVLLLIGRLAGAAEVGQTLAAVLAALVSAVEWGSFYVFAAMLYRQVTGRG